MRITLIPVPEMHGRPCRTSGEEVNKESIAVLMTLAPSLSLRLAQTGGNRLGSSCSCRHLHVRHAAENNSLTPRDAFGIHLRVEDGARVGNHRGKKRGFARVQVRGRFVKVILRRGFRAIEAVA